MHTKYTITYTIIVGDFMKRFTIPSIPPTTNKCIRFPNNIIEEVEKIISGTSCTFNAFTAFVIEAVKVAIENVHEDEEMKK